MTEHEQRAHPTPALADGLEHVASELARLRAVLEPPPRPRDFIPGVTEVWTAGAETRAAVGELEPATTTLWGGDTEPVTTPAAARPAAASAPEAEKARVVLRGQVVNAPGFFTTPTGKPIAKFLLDVTEEESITRHTILAFNERVQAVRDRVRKGQEVECIGYRNSRQVKGPDGQLQTVEEIHLTVVKRPKAT